MIAVDRSFVSIALLGAVHGLNPGMGWLFAVSLGLQARSGRAVWAALGPLALGHAVAVAAALACAAVLGVVLPLAWLRWITAGALVTFGVLQLRRHVHPRWGGMCVGARDLTVWSFLMASAHGAGLMVLPFVLRLAAPGPRAPHGAGASAHAGHLAVAGLPGADAAAAVATLLHTASYLTVSGAVAWVVYKKLGLRLLRRAWINVNLVWAIALIVTAAATPFF